jgi:preprotein translocase subunit SecG
MIYAFLIIIHVLVCVFLVLVILMQASKGKGLAGAFGGAAMASAVLGTRGTATFLSKATTYLAIVFMVSCLLLSLLTGRATSTRSVVQEATPVQSSPAQNLPLVPGALDQGAGESSLPGGAPSQTIPQPAQTPTPTGQTQAQPEK